MDNIRVEDIREYMSTSHEGGGGNSVYFTPHVDNSGNLSWTNNGNLLNPETVNIKGAKGDKGDTGAQGPQGKQGLKGDTGEDGDAGVITNVTASVDNNVGTPSVQVTLGGTPNQRTIDLAFHNLKGSPGSGGSGGNDEEITNLTNRVTTLENKTSIIDNNKRVSTSRITATQGIFGNNNQVTINNAGINVKGNITANKLTAGTIMLDSVNSWDSSGLTVNGNHVITESIIGNAANKIPKYNSEGHLVLPSGAEIW